MSNDPFDALRRKDITPHDVHSDRNWVQQDPRSKRAERPSLLSRILPRKPERFSVTSVGRSDKLVQADWTREDGKRFSGLLHAVEEEK
jgi:hypothetical protein